MVRAALGRLTSHAASGNFAVQTGELTMAAFNKFQVFGEDLHKGVHQLHAAGHTLRVYLTNAVPSASADLVKADLAEIAIQNGYTGPVDIENDVSRSGGTTSVTAVDKVITASGGPIGPFQHAVVFNDTPTSPADPLVGWYDYGAPLTLQDGETLTIDFGASLFQHA